MNIKEPVSVEDMITGEKFPFDWLEKNNWTLAYFTVRCASLADRSFRQWAGFEPYSETCCRFTLISFSGPMSPDGFRGLRLFRKSPMGDDVHRLTVLPYWMKSPMKRLRYTVAIVTASSFSGFNSPETFNSVPGFQTLPRDFPLSETSPATHRRPRSR